MIDVQTFEKHLMRRPHHVIVRIAGKFHPQAIGRLAGLAVPDQIREDDEVPPDVQGLPGPKSTSENTGLSSECASPPVP